MATNEFRLPDPGEGLVEAEIVTWRVAVGDEVKINDIVVEIETSKSLVELPSPYAGTVTALLADEGDMVDVGAPIIAIDDGVPDVTEPADSAEPAEHRPDRQARPRPADAGGEGAQRGPERRRRRGPGARREPRRLRPPVHRGAPAPARARVPGAPTAHGSVRARSDDPAAHVPAQAPVSSYALPAEPEAPAAPSAAVPVGGRGRAGQAAGPQARPRPRRRPRA